VGVRTGTTSRPAPILGTIFSSRCQISRIRRMPREQARESIMQPNTNLFSPGRDPSAATGLPTEAAMAAKVGGARRDRTDDLLLAKQALSQLSYGPCWQVRLGKSVATPAFALIRVEDARERALGFGGNLGRPRRLARQPKRRWPRRLVGLGRFELPTSRLSSARSNQLSYKP
jgi:hypothetical protein